MKKNGERISLVVGQLRVKGHKSSRGLCMSVAQRLSCCCPTSTFQGFATHTKGFRSPLHAQRNRSALAIRPHAFPFVFEHVVHVMAPLSIWVRLGRIENALPALFVDLLRVRIKNIPAAPPSTAPWQTGTA